MKVMQKQVAVNSVPSKWFIEDHDAQKFYRYIIFKNVRDPEDCPPHTHKRDHWTRCIEGRVEVRLDDALTVLAKGQGVFVPAIAMHSAMGLEPNSKMCCEFDHFDGDGHPSSTLGPREDYC